MTPANLVLFIRKGGCQSRLFHVLQPLLKALVKATSPWSSRASSQVLGFVQGRQTVAQHGGVLHRLGHRHGAGIGGHGKCRKTLRVGALLPALLLVGPDLVGERLTPRRKNAGKGSTEIGIGERQFMREIVERTAAHETLPLQFRRHGLEHSPHAVARRSCRCPMNLPLNITPETALVSPVVELRQYTLKPGSVKR